MRWCAVSLVVCTGCLQPNPSFKPGSTSGGSETASTDDTVDDLGTSPTEADDDDDGTSTSEVTSDVTSAGSSPTTDPSTTMDPSSSDGSESSDTTGPAGEHTIFVTSSDYSGDFGSIAVVDELCTQLATDAGLGGTWRALLSDTNVDARDHVDVTGPVRNIMGELIAEDEADLWDGFIAAPVAYNENGEQSLSSPHTGTAVDGTFSGSNCSDWTIAGGGSGTVGDAGYAGEQWIDSGTSGCSQSLPFYCISQ